ncbi:hypothetical protein QYF36_020132 [Acer negundo]|nr:hypothetical protein QYF36_020132 [Acer negundo]
MGFVVKVTEFAINVAGENFAAVAAEELDDTHSMAQLQWRRLGAVGEIGGGGLRRSMSYPGDATKEE